MKIKNILAAMLLLAVLVFTGCNQVTTAEVAEIETEMPIFEEEPVEGALPVGWLDVDADGSIVSKGVYDQNPSGYVTINETSTGKYVATIDLRPAGKTAYTSVLFSIYNDSGTNSGYAINISDSPTCNGWGGDAGTQTNDSELQVQDNKMMIFQSDLGGRTSIELPPDSDSEANAVHNFIPAGGTARRIEIGNNRVSWWLGSSGQAEATKISVAHSHIFALDGQNDPEGPENYKIHLGVNRTVYSASRSGSGITRVYIYVRHAVPSSPLKRVKVLTKYDNAFRAGSQLYAVEPTSFVPPNVPDSNHFWLPMDNSNDPVMALFPSNSLTFHTRASALHLWGFDTRNYPVMAIEWLSNLP